MITFAISNNLSTPFSISLPDSFNIGILMSVYIRFGVICVLIPFEVDLFPVY